MNEFDIEKQIQELRDLQELKVAYELIQFYNLDSFDKMARIQLAINLIDNHQTPAQPKDFADDRDSQVVAL